MNFLPLASATSGSGTVVAIPICDIPTKPTTGTDVARPKGLPEAIQMEDVSVAEQVQKFREFPRSTRHHLCHWNFDVEYIYGFVMLGRFVRQVDDVTAQPFQRTVTPARATP